MKDGSKKNDSYREIVDVLLNLPHKILQNEELEKLVQIVLHEICHHKKLGANRAIYLVDNPEFGCIKGVAGFCKDECKLHNNDLWRDPASFHKDMMNAEFHKKIENFSHDSVCFARGPKCREMSKLAKKIGIKNPIVHSWEIRNGNRGVLILEKDEGTIEKKDKTLFDRIAALLGLCRIN